METYNLTGTLEFLLLDLSEDTELQFIFFVLFLLIYLLTVLGNVLIILAISSDSQLHSPMYFFLYNLSLSDMGFSSTTVPKMLINMQTHNKSITYAGCLTQVFFFILFGGMDSLLLTAMAYDRWVAICHPLHYQVILNPRLCRCLLILSFFISVLSSQVHCLMVSQLTFCTNMEIHHFFCDVPELLKLSCSDSFISNIVRIILSIILGFLPMSGILYSYYKITSSIFKFPSLLGKYKVFSTCGSHLSVVCLFYGTGIGVYLSSTVSSSYGESMVASVLYIMVVPMINPFIYSLRNKDIKKALQKIVRQIL
ncbi:olfactory receptor Olr1160 [Rattus norvegicus]|uniref:Olfactory receptor n=1 Tax=Rattus norvegicus TaxID=10116 RepID=D3ZS94_RAT|nr:olfactory receptor Olr1160 [Rattus norvegicus]|eukprot:NP_001000985.1 olfactory receptor Olr1160 [Rattus norvegicus]